MADMIPVASIRPLENPFSFSEHQVRTAVDAQGEVWFCAKDVFDALGITWSQRTGSLKNYPENWVCPLYLQGQSGSGEVIFISEPAVYKALFSSRRPEAEAFANWVCEEVLPAIRKQGFFGQVTPGQQIQLRNVQLKLLAQLPTKDAFVYESVLTSLRNVCNLLGEAMPDPALIGKNRHQMHLEGI